MVGACGWLVGIKRSLGALLLTASPLRDSKGALFMQDLVLLPFSLREWVLHATMFASLLDAPRPSDDLCRLV